MKLGGDKGGDVLNTFKMNFQIVNVPVPNSVHNTCVFSCFEAGDSVTNLHSALKLFQRPSEAAAGDGVEVHKASVNCNKELQAFANRQHTTKVFLTGDYEFLSTIYGLSGASGKKSIWSLSLSACHTFPENIHA